MNIIIIHAKEYKLKMIVKLILDQSAKMYFDLIT